MTNDDKEHSGAADAPDIAGQASNPGPMGNPSDAALAGSAGNTGNVGGGAAGSGGGADTGGMTTTRSPDQAGGSIAPRTGVLIPPVDVIEDASGITLLADMPGVSKDKLDLRLETNSLTIHGAVSLDVPEGMESRYAEVKHQQYQRTFALSKELDGEQASAELAHGVLKIRIPKTAHAQPRRVQINVA
ncbi:Hsp20/alpha crystallin family protein [Massilia violaceinigra]|nr:Hsp20/alpha crystallin family protein [Massilia violaceinigra]